jgi:hypothetical protein
MSLPPPLHIRPLTHVPQTFIWSDAPVHYKISMSSYMFSYYGIAASTALSIVNYLILGFALNVDGFYMHSFEIWLACMVVFPCAGNVGYTILEYRLGNRSLLAALIENSTWVPFLCVAPIAIRIVLRLLIWCFFPTLRSFFFFGGLSIHLTTALLAHMFSYNMTWQATKKVCFASVCSVRLALPMLITSCHVIRRSNGPTSGSRSRGFGTASGSRSAYVSCSSR